MASRASIWTGFAALALGVAVSGCGTSGAKSPPAGSVTEKGQYGVYFLVSLPKPTGGTIRSSDDQIACGTGGAACGPARYDWTATATLTAQADAGYTFFGWAGDCGGQGSCSVNNTYFAADKTIAAVFTNGTSWNVVVLKVGTGRGSVSATIGGQGVGSCDAALAKCDLQVPISNPPAQVTLTALPDLSSHFGGWSGGLCSGKAPCTIEVDKAKSVVADFEPGPDSYPVGGTVAGLVGSGLVLRDNGGDDLSIGADGAFTFATRVAVGAAYSVTVASQPTSPSQTCVVANGSGTIGSAPVANVAVTCTTNTYAVGGTVTGLAGSGLVLRNNGGDDLSVASNGSFQFATPIQSGLTYSVTVAVQPHGPVQACSVSGGTGTVLAGSVAAIQVVCAQPPAAGCADLAEYDIPLRWTYSMASGSGFTTTVTELMSPGMFRGRAAVRAVTTAAFDFALVYAPPAPMDVSSFEEVRFAVRALNTNILVNGSPWQGNFPVVVLQDSTGARRTLTPTTNRMPWDGITWAQLSVPVAGGSSWTASGAVDLSRLVRIEIHSDTWEWNAQTIDVDGLSFEHPQTTCPAIAGPWMTGVDGHLVVASGEVKQLTAGLVYDFASVTVATGGLLQIGPAAGPSGAWTFVGAVGAITVDGAIVASGGRDTTSTFATRAPVPGGTLSGEPLSYSVTVAAGGDGGAGGWNWYAGGYRGTPGGGGLAAFGNGGGGGAGMDPGWGGSPASAPGGAATASAGGSGGSVPWGSITGGTGGTIFGADGARGVNGETDPWGGAHAGAGGGGGALGAHGLGLYLQAAGGIGGTGSISAAGGKGGNGGGGGDRAYGPRDSSYSGSGGAGGGGAGGSGGALVIRYPAGRPAPTPSLDVSGGQGGLGAQQAGDLTAGQSGADGSPGAVGQLDVAPF